MKTLFPFLYKIYWYTLRPVKHCFFGCYQILKIKNIQKEREITVVLANCIGDNVYGLAFLRCIKKTTGFIVTLYAPDNMKKLVDYYADDYDHVIFVERRSFEWSRLMSISQLKWLTKVAVKNRIYPVLLHPSHFNSRVDKRDCLSILRQDVFSNLLSSRGEDVELVYPNFADEEIKSICNFEKVKGKVAILNPYSASMDNEMMSLYEKITDFLLDRGFSIYTNVIADQKEIKGSLPLRCSIYEFYAICDNVPLVVSVRSGIIDLCISAKTNFLIFYLPFKKYSWRYNHRTFYNLYTLKAWKTGNVTEHLFETPSGAFGAFESFYENIICN